MQGGHSWRFFPGMSCGGGETDGPLLLQIRTISKWFYLDLHQHFTGLFGPAPVDIRRWIEAWFSWYQLNRLNISDAAATDTPGLDTHPILQPIPPLAFSWTFGACSWSHGSNKWNDVPTFVTAVIHTAALPENWLQWCSVPPELSPTLRTGNWRS